jgi:GTP:adenosylcobinamide-phosphate guanylyltransferase
VSQSSAFTALILAGTRPGGDPFARSVGVSHKALIPVGETPMLVRVVRALRAARSIGRIAITGMNRASLQSLPELDASIDRGEISLLDGRATPSASVLEALESLAGAVPLVVTTADHPLLSPDIIDEFADAAAAAKVDVAVGLVAADAVRAAFPDVRRTVLPLRGAAYCGCNLFALMTDEARRAPAFWSEIEQHRKRPWRMILPLGVREVVRFALRRLTLEEVVDLAAKKMGVRVRAVVLSQPAAGFDVDKRDHLEAAERYLAAKAGAGR